MCNGVTVAAYLIFVVCLLVVTSGGTKGRAVMCAPNPPPLKSRQHGSDANSLIFISIYQHGYVDN